MKKLILGGFIGILLILVWKSLQIYLPAFPAYDWAFQLSREHSSYQHFYHSVHTVIVPFLSILLLCSGVFLLFFRKKIQSVFWLILVIPVLIIAFLYTYLSSIGTSLPGISLLFSGYFYLLVLALSLALFLLILWGIGSKLEPLLIKKSERSKETAITALNQLFLGSGLMLTNCG